jgi:hypothetical protein
MTKQVDPSLHDGYALQWLIEKAGNPPLAAVAKPEPMSFGITAHELVRLEKSEEQHKLASARTSLGCVAAVFAFALAGAIVWVAWLAFEVGDVLVWGLLVSGYFAVLCWEGVREAVLRWKSGRNPYRRSGLPQLIMQRMIEFRAAESAWLSAESARIEKWRADIRSRALVQLQHDKVAQRLRGSYWKGLAGLEFERELGGLYGCLGYSVTQTKATGDGGVDLLLKRESETIVVQCKQHAKPAAPAVVRDLYGTMIHRKASSAIVACTSGFSKEARKFALGKPISLIGLEEIIQLVAQSERAKNGRK